MLSSTGSLLLTLQLLHPENEMILLRTFTKTNKIFSQLLFPFIIGYVNNSSDHAVKARFTFYTKEFIGNH